MGTESADDTAIRVAGLRAQKDVAALRAMLAPGPALSQRRMAADALLALGDEAALDAIGTLMARPEADLSDHVLQRLGEMPGGNAVRLISRGLGAQDPFWRNRALEALLHRSEPEALGLMIPATRDRSGAIRQLAVRHIRRIVADSPDRAAGLPPARLDQIIGLLEREEVFDRFRSGPSELRCAAARRLGALGGPQAYEALADAAATATGELGDGALTALEGAREAPADWFRPLIGHASPSVRRRALLACVVRDPAGARALLPSSIEDPAAEVREAALRSAAGRLGPEALPVAAPRIQDPSAPVRVAAVDLLAQWAVDEATDLLRRASVDREDRVRWRALLALARRGFVDPAQAITYAELLTGIAAREKLSADEIDGLCAIAGCLGRLGGADAERAADSLVTAAGSSALRLRRAAVEAIQRMPVEPRLRAFAGLADTHDRSILKVIGLGLGEARAPAGLVPLLRILDECGGKPADQARGHLDHYAEARQLDSLVGLLKNRWVSVRRFAAEGLRDLNDERSVPPLMEALGDEDVEVQLAAVLALSRFASRSEVAERLIAAVEYGDLTVRQTAVEALGEAKVSAAVPMLIRALGNPFLRTRAEHAIRAIGDRKGWLAVRRRRLREKLFKKKKPTPAERLRAEQTGRPKPGSPKPRR